MMGSRFIKINYLVISILILVPLILGCSSKGSPVTPADTVPVTTNQFGTTMQNHLLWGYYHVEIDPVSLEAEIVPARSADFNCNVLVFLQPPVSQNNLVSIYVDEYNSDFANNFISVYITLRHPFPDYPKFRGFDVRGIFMANASQSNQHDPTATYPAWWDVEQSSPTTEAVLLNPDGYTRWWNPTEFTTTGIILGYTRGHFSPEDYHSNSTINAYKVFADDLTATDPVNLDPANRGTFGSNSGTITRLYEIQFDTTGKPWKFEYAVDASWAQPDDADPTFPVSAYPPEANCQEAYLINLDTSGSDAWFTSDITFGGDFVLNVEIFDWQADTSAFPSTILDEISSVHVESPAFSGGGGSNTVNLLSGPYEILPGSNSTSAIIRATVNPNFSQSGITAPGEYPVMIAVGSNDPATYEPQIEGDTSQFAYPSAPLEAWKTDYVTVAEGVIMDPPVVLSVVPDEGIAETWVYNMEIHGTGFQTGAEIEFTKADLTWQSGFYPANFVDPALLTMNVPLIGVPVGMYNVTVRNPDLQQDTLENCFEVIEPVADNLVFGPEIAFEPVHANVDMRSPAITLEHDNQLVFAFYETRTNFPFYRSWSGSFKSYDSGVTWPDYEGTMDFFGPWHYSDTVKIWPSSHNISYQTHTLAILIPQLTFSSGFVGTTFSDGPNGDEYASFTYLTLDHANEIVQDADGYIYHMSDSNGNIHYRRSEVPECLNCGDYWDFWMELESRQVTDIGRLSNSRSSALYNGTMYLAYYVPGAPDIMLASSVDGQIWDTIPVYDGAPSPDTIRSRDPSLLVDETGFHISFHRHLTDTDLDQLVYINSPDGVNWSPPVTVHEAFDWTFNTAISGYWLDDDYVLGVIWLEGVDILVKFSRDMGQTWSAPVSIPSLNGINGSPDMIISPDGFWHVVFHSQNPTTGKYQIHYRRGWLE